MSANYMCLESRIKKIGCYLGIVQGVSYAVLALICIVLYNIEILNLLPNGYMNTINILWYTFYLGRNIRVFEDQTITPGIFSGFVWVHFTFCVTWVGLSFYALYKKNVNTQEHLKRWSYLVFLICLWDLVIVIILGIDYNKCIHFANKYFWLPDEKIANQQICASAVLPILVIAARGFVLWIVNVVFGVVNFRIYRRLETKVQTSVKASQFSFQKAERRHPVICTMPSIPEPDYDLPSFPKKQ